MLEGDDGEAPYLQDAGGVGSTGTHGHRAVASTIDFEQRPGSVPGQASSERMHQGRNLPAAHLAHGEEEHPLVLIIFALFNS